MFGRDESRLGELERCNSTAGMKFASFSAYPADTDLAKILGLKINGSHNSMVFRNVNPWILGFLKCQIFSRDTYFLLHPFICVHCTMW